MSAFEYRGAVQRTSENEGLFHGITFWLSRTVPLRKRFIDDIVHNGGAITEDEQIADMRIYDHARKKVPAGTYSYTWIDASIKNGVLADKNEHCAGPAEGVPRQPGDETRPTKVGRNRFTKEQDCILWDHVTKALKDGGKISGNVIYQQLENMYPEHTFHSWRDRWLKHLKDRPRPVPLPDHDAAASARTEDPPAAAPSTPRQASPPRTEPAVVHSSIETTPGEKKVSSTAVPNPIPSTKTSQSSEVELWQLTAEDIKKLTDNGSDIENLDPDKIDSAWDMWAADEVNQHATGQQWKALWETYAREIWLSIENAISRTPSASRHLQQPAQPRDGETGMAVPSSLAADHQDTPQSPSQRAKANSSKRLTGGRGSANNSQSTGSQPTSQESVAKLPAAEKKRKREEPASTSATLPVPNKRQSTSKQQSEAPAEMVPKTETQEGDTVYVEADEMLRPSPSLTEPNSKPSRNEGKGEVIVHDTVSDDSEDSDDSIDISNEVKADGGQETFTLRPEVEIPSQSLRHERSQPPPNLDDDSSSSSDSFTTIPGNTARQYHRSPTPRRRDRLNTSSQFTTTPPGNTAPAPFTSSLSLPKELQESAKGLSQSDVGDTSQISTAIVPEEANTQSHIDEEDEPQSKGVENKKQPQPWTSDTSSENSEEESSEDDDEDSSTIGGPDMVIEFRQKWTGYGYTEEQVHLALHATTFHKTAAEKAIRYLKNHKDELPLDMKGIFTAEDDANLMHGQPRRRALVEIKHGRLLCRERLKMLAA